MVKPPAISIRRLMPHRRAGSDGSDNLDESSADEHELRSRSNSFKQQTSPQPWLPQSKTKGSGSPRGMRKPGTAARAPSPLPHVSVFNINSNPENKESVRQKKAAAVLGLPSRSMPAAGPPKRPARPSNGHLGLDETIPPRSPRPLQGQRPESPLPPQVIRSESPHLPYTYRPESPLPLFSLNDSRSPSPRLPSNVNEARPDSPFLPLNDSRVEKHGLPTPPGCQHEDWSDNVMQLIHETDQAFKAVGSALADAKLASYSFDRTQTPTPPPSLPTKELPPLPRPSKDHTRDQSVTSLEVPIFMDTTPEAMTAEAHAATIVRCTTPPRKVSTPEPSATAISAPNSTTTTPVSTPTKPNTPTPRSVPSAKPSKAKRWPAMSQAMAARLGFSGNVTDILTGQRFKKIEVDEMLTADQIKELKKIRDDTQKQSDEQERQRASVESQRSPSWDQSKSQSQESVVEAPAQPTSSDSEYEEEEYEETHEDWKAKNKDEVADAATAPKFPPRKESRNAATLPAVPTTEGQEEGPSAREQMLESLMGEEDDRYVYLKSTPYTLTSPCFQHGKITLSKAEVAKVKMTVDDTMDWTAFQMAILGGAGDLMSGLYDDDDETEDELVDDVSSWFDTLGFESFGELVGAESRSARDSAQSVSSNSSLSSMDAEMGYRMPICGESPTSFWRETPDLKLDTTKFLRSSGLKRWSAVPEPRPKRASHTRDSSLPTSPMMPLVVSGLGADSVIDESVADGTVTMGYNLHNDLGDFLRWEAEQMFGSGYYGAPRA